MRMAALLFAIVSVAVVVMGCASAGVNSSGTPGDASVTPEPSATETTASSSPATSTPGASQSPTGAQSPVPTEAVPSVDAAKQHLAQQSGVPVDQITALSVTKVNWPTSALGCPQPGRMYAQMVTPGYRIILQAGGKTYEYHSDRGQHVVSC